MNRRVLLECSSMTLFRWLVVGNYHKLDLRHEETFQIVRSWQRRGRIVDKLIVIFLLIASMEHSFATKSSQSGRRGHPDRATGGQIEPARASQERPNRASQIAQGTQIEPFEARSSQPGRARSARGLQIEPARAPRAGRGQPGRTRPLGWSPS